MSLVPDADGFPGHYPHGFVVIPCDPLGTRIPALASGMLDPGPRPVLCGPLDETFERLQGKLPGVFAFPQRPRDHLSLAISPGQYRCS